MEREYDEKKDCRLQSGDQDPSPSQGVSGVLALQWSRTFFYMFCKQHADAQSWQLDR